MLVGTVALLLMAAAAIAGAVGVPQLGRWPARIATLAGGCALGRLVWAFAASDWSSVYVADHARSGLPVLLRLAGLWAGPEGSLLLFTFGLAAAWSITERLHDQPNRWGAALTGSFAVLILIAASPFERLAIPAVDGLGLQPILEHPAMVWHPPMLYAGLVGLTIPMFFVLGRESPDRQVPIPTLLMPLALLAGGLVSGARWAHAELGWGGYWAWDPIESAGLVAWMSGAAALHRARHLGRWSTAIFVLPGLCAVWATTLTRIGVVDSVHAFSDRPTLRVGLLLITSALTGAAGATVTADLRATSSTLARPRVPAGRRRAFVVLLAGAGVVGLGTYEPLVEAAVGGDAVAIAGQYFARVMWPVVIVGALAAVLADRRYVLAGLGGLIGALLTPIAAGPFGLAVGAAGGAVAISAVSARRRGTLAHLGLGILLVGIAGTMASTVQLAVLSQGRPVTLNGETFEQVGIELEEGSVRSAAVATVLVDGDPVETRLVRHELRGASTAEVGHRNSWTGETQIVLIDGTDASATYRINHHPRIALVWLGGVLAAVGLLVGAVGSRQGLRRLRASNWSMVDPASSSAGGGEAAGAAGGAVGGPSAVTGRADVSDGGADGV